LPTVSVTLPFAFDTSGTVGAILRGVTVLLLVVVVPGVLYLLLARRNVAGAGLLAAIGVFVIVFGRIVLGQLEGTKGIVAADAVSVEPASFFGMRLAGPAGRFPIDRFARVLVERIPDSGTIESVPHERVKLVGKQGTPDILIARTTGGEGKTMGKELAALLRLPYEDRLEAY
jgi:hypothetical protein